MNPSPEPEQEIQPADPVTRNRAIWLVLVVVILGGALALAVQFKEDQINQWLNRNIEILIQQPGIIFLVAFVIMLPLVGAAMHIYRVADQVVKAERMPPPGRKVIKDTPIVRGAKAVRQGRGLKVTAVIMGLIGTLLPLGLAVILMMLQKSI